MPAFIVVPSLIWRCHSSVNGHDAQILGKVKPEVAKELGLTSDVAVAPGR